MQRALIGPHVNDWTGPATRDVQAIHNGGIIKCLAPHPALATYAANSPDSIRIGRQYFPDNDLGSWRHRCDVILAAWGDAYRNGWINAIELPHNEKNDDLVHLLPVQRDSAEYLREKMQGIKIVGGNWGVGNPANLPNDWKIIGPFLKHFDYLGLHEYAYPHFLPDDNGHDRPTLADGRKAGYWWMRYRFVYQWLAQQGFDTPPLILTEFGIDLNGDHTGWRSTGISDKQFKQMVTGAVQEMAQDEFFAGAALYCHGVNDKRWDSYDSAGSGTILDLFNVQFVSMYDGARGGGKEVQPPVPIIIPVTEFEQWKTDPANKHRQGTWDYLKSFIAKREDSAGVPRGTFGVKDALAGGFPANMAHDILVALPDAVRPRSVAAFIANIPARRLKAVELVESGGVGIDSDTGWPIIRFEVGDWLVTLADKPHQKEQADKWFRIVDGMHAWDTEAQEIHWKGEWVKVMDGGQSLRIAALTIAEGIDDTAWDWTSAGVAQILGMNHDACGYPDARSMILAFKDMAAQVTALAKFIAANPVMADAIRRGDALSFARSWNGEGQPEQYAELLKETGLWK